MYSQVSRVKKKKKITIIILSTLPVSSTTRQPEEQFVIRHYRVLRFRPIAPQTNPIIGDTREIRDEERFI